jgi:structural maintenance of chromosome 3 (chondroitin sulfate proteoglycan 6)
MDGKTLKMVQDELFKKFQENFIVLFQTIVPTGYPINRNSRSCQVRLIKTAKRNKKTNQFLFGIDIRVAFKHGDMQNWYTLSQGEKTVIAFAIVIALQKCEPAPFYILDEFDAALDDNYRM